MSQALRFSLPILIYLASSLPCLADSAVRIVRLSQVDGAVEIDRGTGQGFEKAIANLPITQGAILKSPSQSRAEVEFEDGSAIRLAPDSTIAFPELLLRDSGGRDSHIEVQRGTAYFDFAGAKDDEFTIQFAQETIRLAHRARLRIMVADKKASLAVFNGDIRVTGPRGSVEVAKRQSVSFDLADENRPELVKNIPPEPYDAWDSEQEQYRQRHASDSYSSYSPYAYGTYDLAYYGNVWNVPGYGMMWRPYLVGMGWDPFMDGAWALYPGWGFGWVSAYPWGWVPYHYGTWIFVPGFGWMWQPGGVWTTWYRQPRVRNPPAGFVLPKPPGSGTATVVVARGPRSEMGSANKLVVRNNSAGLGIPRGQLDNLRSLSAKAQKRGTVTQRFSTSPALAPSGHQAIDASRHVSQTSGREVSMPRSHSGAPPAAMATPHR